jgi:hypothetical protein
MRESEKDVFGPKKYVDQHGHTECVTFVRQVTGAPQTILWKRGISVKDAKLGEIARGTAIATFDDAGRYPKDGLGKHAALFLGKTPSGIQVLDQWNAQGKVLPRTIRFNHPGRRSNNGDTFYVIE